MSENDATRLAELLAIDLHALPEAVHTDIDRRTKDETHDCVRCAARAEVAFLAGPSTEINLSARWIDLCPPCSMRVREFAHEENIRQGADRFPTHGQVWERAREKWQASRPERVRAAVAGAWVRAFAGERLEAPEPTLGDDQQLTIPGATQAILLAESEVGQRREEVRSHWQVRALADQVAERICDLEGRIDGSGLRRANGVVDVLVGAVYQGA